MLSSNTRRVFLTALGVTTLVAILFGSPPPERMASAAPPPPYPTSQFRDEARPQLRYWDNEPRSAARVMTGDQMTVIPGSEDEVRVIAQLRDEPVVVRRAQILGTRRLLAPSERESLRQYAVTQSAQRRQFVGLVQQQRIALNVRREFGNLVNGVAFTIKMRDWKRLAQIPIVKAVYPDYEARVLLSESVPLIGATQVWRLKDANGQAVTGQGIRIAIIDTGVDYTHPDLGGCFGSTCHVMGGYDFVSNDNDPMDLNGHGTHVAGIIAANGMLKGVAPDARLLAYRVLDANGVGKESDIIAAIDRASDPDGDPGTDDNAQIINLSLGGDGNSDDLLSQAVDNAVAQGIVVVAAAGNFGGYGFQTLTSPGVARQAITVAASDKSDQYAILSSRGPILDYENVLKPDVTAPGVSINSTVPLAGALGSADRYRVLSGTSMAAPHVSGGAALLKQMHPDWSPAFVKASLMNTAKDLGKSIYQQGAGRIQVAQAITTTLVAVPSSLGFGIPGSSKVTMPLTLTNLSSSTITATSSINALLWANDALLPLTNPVPVSYATIDRSEISIAPAAMSVLSVTVSAPTDAVEGYYVGNVMLQSDSAAWQVPLAFMVLSKVRVHILDENNAEVTKLDTDFRQQGAAYLLRMPELDVRRSSDYGNQVPSTFYVPSGMYNVHGYAHFWIYDAALGLSKTTSRPLFLSTSVTVQRNQTQDVYLRAVDAHRFTLDASTFEGAAQFLSRWRAISRFRNNGKEYPTGLDISYTGYKDSYFGFPLPSTLDFYLSDTLPNMDFAFAIDGYGNSARQASFEQLNSSVWYEDIRNGSGFDLSQNADQAYWFAWQYPRITSLTPRTFHYAREQVSHYSAHYDLYGILERAGNLLDTNLSGGGGAAFYLPTDNFASLSPLTPGLDRDLYLKGNFAYREWNYRANGDQMFEHEHYYRDWTTAVTTTQAADVWTIAGDDLQAVSPQEGSLTIGAGPFYPAATFNNDAGTIRLINPLLGSSNGLKAVWGDAPTLTIYHENTRQYSARLNEWWWTPSTMRQIPVSESGAYRVIITSTASASLASKNLIAAGFTIPSADMNPPRITALEMPQRFSAGQTIPVMITVTDAETGVRAVQFQISRDGGATWTPLAVNQSGNRYSAQIGTAQASSISLRMSASDYAGNYLALISQPAAVLETPTAFALNLFPNTILLSSQPTTIHLTGALKKMDGQPLGQAALPVRIYLNDNYVGYIRNVSRISNGVLNGGDISFTWKFIPTDFIHAPGIAQLKFVFDVGGYARQEKTFSVIVGDSLIQKLFPFVSR